MKTAKFKKMILITISIFLIFGLPTQAFAATEAEETDEDIATEAIETADDAQANDQAQATEEQETAKNTDTAANNNSKTEEVKDANLYRLALEDKNVQRTNTAVTVTWEKEADATGYEMEIAEDINFTNNAQTIDTKATKATKSGLNQNKTYYVRVRAYAPKNAQGTKKYSSWSAKKAAKVEAAKSTTTQNTTAAQNTTATKQSAATNTPKTTVTTKKAVATTNTVKAFNYSVCLAQIKKASKGGTNYFQLANPVSKASVKSVESKIQKTMPYAQPVSLMSVRISGGKVTAYCFNTANYKKMANQNAKIKNKVRKISRTKAMKFNKKTSQKAKVMKIAQYIVNHSKYSYTRHSVEDNLLRGQSSCGGYAYAFKSMCKYYGINCKVVYGYNKRNEGHAWNRVKVGGAWYNIDVCWYDSGKNGTYTTKYGLKKGLWADHKQYKYQGYTEV